MAGVNVDIDGLAGVLRAIGRIPEAGRRAREETLHEWAEDVQDTAEDLVPRRTGALWESLDHKVFASDGVALAGVWDENTLEYAQYVEKGTSSMPDQPYLVPAFEAHRREVAPAYRRRFVEHVRGI